MHDEDGFLAVIRQTPADDTARLVYADWLDEQDDGAFKLKAEFIRLELRLVNEPFSFGLTAHLQLLAGQLDRDWLVVVSRPKIEGCPARRELRCPTVWSALSPTSELEVRTCDACQQTVCYAHTDFPAYHYIRRGHPTVISLAVRRTPDALRLPRQLTTAELTREPLIERPRLPRTRAERWPNRRELAKSIGDESQSPRSGRQPPPARRQKSRRRYRNIQRENWEEAE
jgi:uncharacterized protein (TIGR02996 family)